MGVYIPTRATHTDQVYMLHHKVLTKHPFKAGSLHDYTLAGVYFLHPIYNSVVAFRDTSASWGGTYVYVTEMSVWST